MKLFLAIVPDEIKSKSIFEEIIKSLGKNIERSIFFTDGTVGKESIFLFVDEKIASTFSVQVSSILVEYFRTKERIVPLESMSVLEPNSKSLASFFVVQQSNVAYLLRRISREIPDRLQDYILSPFSNPERIVPGEVICFGSTDNVRQVFYLSEYKMLDVFIIDGQFKLDSINAGRSVLRGYNKTKLAGIEFGEDLKDGFKNGLKNLHTGLGKFIENIDK